MSAISKACAELTNSIKGLRLPTTKRQENLHPTRNPGCSSGIGSVGGLLPQRMTSASNGHSPGLPKATKLKILHINGNIHAVKHAKDLWLDDRFLSQFFFYFLPSERLVLAQVCKKWRDLLYQAQFWQGVTAVVKSRDWKEEDKMKKFYHSLQKRGFDSLCLEGAADKDLSDMFANYPACRKHIRSVSLRYSNVTDSGLELMFQRMQCIYKLELSGCNEITEAGLWACLNPKIVSLTVSDCINVADDTVGAISQLLPSLHELDLQAYHVTDAALSFFSSKQSNTLTALKLKSCWEITNHGIVNVVHSLPNLTVLSLQGCSKITDDGVEIIAENLRKLRVLDLSWCPRVTDASLEYIACDLCLLEELTLDRCQHVTDIGVGYLSTMTSLAKLYLRWCTQVRDFGLQHLYTMKSLRMLSVAGCSQLTPSGIMGLVQMRHLEELEVTNCQGARQDVYKYLKENLPKCVIIP
ncbi:F-box/LRR-repeat protein 16 [Lingula anatina]|uniref:F-box/LRR-repeat protein 16 n=1 Tax=Lingula anatina TaxID=7574 RepID=A0A1S3K0D5_LINAN|nr:F-box/LRR-repeat protein 16 [Lingula anatina]|eukprot:XP_013416098.1 F-box/LRR-repeat protein 16 [Lingula anatina]